MTVHIILTMIALVLILVIGTWYAKKRFKISLAVMGLGAIAFFCFFSSVREDGSPSDTSSAKRWNHSAYAGAAFLICPLWNRYGSPL